jgi:hypothetical protein
MTTNEQIENFLIQLPVDYSENSFWTSHNNVEFHVIDNWVQNKNLWKLEDQCRTCEDNDQRGALKVRIDTTNQRRNDAIEAIDAAMLETLPTTRGGMITTHSETPGMMIDRLCIMHLKHRAYLKRVKDNNEAYQRSVLLGEQISDLHGHLLALWGDLWRGYKVLKVYRALKVYGDQKGCGYGR